MSCQREELPTSQKMQHSGTYNHATDHLGAADVGIAERIYEVVKGLAEPAASDVLQYAEAKRAGAGDPSGAASRRTAALAVLDKHARRFKTQKLDRADLHDRAGFR
jgi:hypothetical protein